MNASSQQRVAQRGDGVSEETAVAAFRNWYREMIGARANGMKPIQVMFEYGTPRFIEAPRRIAG